MGGLLQDGDANLIGEMVDDRLVAIDRRSGLISVLLKRFAQPPNPVAASKRVVEPPLVPINKANFKR